MTQKPKLGATGSFPRGHFDKDDEGELRLAVTVRDRTIIIDFGKPVAWIGLDKIAATQLAATILKRVKEL